MTAHLTRREESERLERGLPLFRVVWVRQDSRPGFHGWSTVAHCFASLEDARAALVAPFGAGALRGKAEEWEGGTWVVVLRRARKGAVDAIARARGAAAEAQHGR